VARQGEFDLLVADLCNEGSTLEDAVAESIEIFSLPSYINKAPNVGFCKRD
jgi:hypothetical protein